MYNGFILKNRLCKYLIIGMALLSTGGCTVNPATGEKQFTAFMPASQEDSIGASGHEEIRAEYGDFVTGPLADYVNRVGQKVAANTERPDVHYKFYVIDSPVVNAFAMPGGYIYVTRGILALANDEAELAGVLGHEVGHVTARHTASRQSQQVLLGLGAAVLSAATGSGAASQVADIGSDLYIKSYSRGQEDQADELGVRYLTRAGYDPRAMAEFLKSLDAQTKLEKRLNGQGDKDGPSYFSTHPVTSERVEHAGILAGNYEGGPNITNRESYLSAINGLVYGDSEDQGFVRGDVFYHPKMGFTFSIPRGFSIMNTASELIATSPDGSLFILDADRDDQGRGAMAYLMQNWMSGKAPQNPESITINGMDAATAAFAGTAKGRAVMIRVVAIEWKPGQFFRFQIAIPQGARTTAVDGLKRTTYSFRRMTKEEIASIKPYKIRLATAGPGDSVESFAGRMALTNYKEERFRVLNGFGPGERLVSGEMYKIVGE